MPPVLSEKIIEKAIAELICESCGAKFSCGARFGECWCFAVEVKAETLESLRGEFKDCLCENCLRRQNAHGTDEQYN